MRRPACLLAALAGLAWPAPASAALFPGDTVDGPGPDVAALGDVDLARDGTGAIAYVKREGGVEHVFVSRFAGGVPLPGERIDAALATASGDPAVAVADGGRLVAVFASGGSVYGIVRPKGGGYAAPVLLGAGERPTVDMSVTGTAYAVWTAAGDVRLARLDRRTDAWTRLAAPADVVPAAAAGTGTRRPRVAVSADSVALVVWGEDGADGRMHVHARKVFGERLSSHPQDLTLAGGDADSPDVDVEDDSSFGWVAYRQLAAGRRAVVARRQRGTQFDPPVALDAPLGAEGAERPRIDLNGRGEGLATLSGEVRHVPVASLLRLDAFAPPVAVGPGGPLVPGAVPTLADSGAGLVAWAQGGGVHVRTFPARRVRPVRASLARPQFGLVDPALGLDAATDRLGSVVVAWVQGPPGARRLVVGAADRPPSRFAVLTRSRFLPPRPTLRWEEARDLWGGVTYRVEVDGRVVARTRRTRAVPARRLRSGRHRWRVLAVDRRGQVTATPLRTVRVVRAGRP